MNTTENGFFDVNSELYFNEKLNLWLNNLSSHDVIKVLKDCFSVPLPDINKESCIYQWDSYDSSFREYGRFDQKIDFGIEACVILELKIGTEATIGQLGKYLSYINAAGYKKGWVVLLSRNQSASEKLGYDMLLKKNPNLLFVTWNEFESKLLSLHKNALLISPKKHTENFLELLTFLTDIKKRSERLIDQQSPPHLNIKEFVKSLELAPEPKKKGTFLCWNNREDFWNELLTDITQLTHLKNFCAFRFDLYEFIIRWAFHKKKVYLDIYEDKNYEYYYAYFFSTIYPAKGDLPSADLSELYYRFLLIRETEILTTDKYSIFFQRKGKNWYVYVLGKDTNVGDIPYVKLHQLRF
jgi:hypothetical protein